MIAHQRGLVEMSRRSLTILKRSQISQQIGLLSNNRRCFITIVNPSAPKIVKIRASAKTPVIEQESEKVVLLRKSLEESNTAAAESVIKGRDNVEDSNVIPAEPVIKDNAEAEPLLKVIEHKEEADIKDLTSAKKNTAAVEDESFKVEIKTSSAENDEIDSSKIEKTEPNQISSSLDHKEDNVVEHQINGPSTDQVQTNKDHVTVTTQAEDVGDSTDQPEVVEVKSKESTDQSKKK